MSSFRRAGTAPSTNVAVSVNARGTKPFINGQILTSSGLRELDTLLGGGFFLGTVIAVEPSVFGDYGTDLLRYFAAEGLVNEHAVYTDAHVRAALPLELSTAQKQLKAHLAEQDKAQSDQPQDAKLTIAWQYGKYSKTINDNRFCHSYDLARSMPEAMQEHWHALDAAQVDMDYKKLFQQMKQALEQRKDRVTRFVIDNIASPLHYGEMDDKHEAELLQFLRAVRGLLSTHRDRAICMLSITTYALQQPLVRHVRHLVDYSFEVTSFLGDSEHLPAELSEFSGLFYVHKLARVHSLTCHAVESVKLGIKRDRRKLKLEHLHLPPEGSRSQKTEKKHEDISF